MVEGGSSKQFSRIKQMMYREPHLLHGLLSKLATSVTQYLNAQIAAGADALMIFDTWGGVLSHQDYCDFSLQYMTQIVQGLHRQYEGRNIPVTLFTKGGGQWLEAIAASGCDAIGLDWTTDIAVARQRVGDKVALQGNMDPAVLYGDDALVKAKVQEILSQYGHGSGHIFNLGHGITPDIDPERVSTFVDAVHQFSETYHQA
jgi:Uroporphyrinogen-III decarboxylase